MYSVDYYRVLRTGAEVPESIAGDVADICPPHDKISVYLINLDFITGGAEGFRPSEGGAVIRDVADLQVGGRIRRILRLQGRGEQEAKN